MRIVELMEANESLEEGMKGLQDEIQVMKDEADRSMSERRSAQEELKELRLRHEELEKLTKEAGTREEETSKLYAMLEEEYDTVSNQLDELRKKAPVNSAHVNSPSG